MRAFLWCASCICLPLLVSTGCSRDHTAVITPTDARQRLHELAAAVVQQAGTRTTQPRLPISSAEWAPSGRACDRDDRRLPADPAAWQVEPWRDLHFAVGPSAWQFRLLRTGTGAREQLLIEARADRDCDGIPASLLVVVDADLHVSPVQAVREDE